MNILSLRVSTVRGNDNLKKNSEVRMEKLVISPEFAEEIKNTLAQEFFENVNHASSVEEQVKLVRKFDCDQSIPVDLKRTVYLSLYLIVPLKHAVRGAIVKILQTSFKDDQLFDEELQSQIELYLKKHNEPSDWRCYFQVISSLTGIFENIGITRNGCARVSKAMFDYLLQVLQRMSDAFFSKDVSPSLTNEILLLNHNILRVVLSLCQEFGGELKSGNSDFPKLIQSLQRFLEDDDVPMDTKTNCGHLSIIIAKINGTYKDLLQKKFNGHGTFCENVGIVVDLSRGDSLKDPETWRLLNIIISETLQESKDNSKQQQMVLACSRLIFRIAKILPQLPEQEKENEVVTSVISQLLEFSFSHLENFMDSVRHMSRDSLKLILSFCLEKKFDKEVDELFSKIRSGCSRNVRFISLSCIASTYGARNVLKEVPNLPVELIENFMENCFDVSAGNCYEVVMLENKKEENVTDWMERWVNPLVLFLNTLSTTEQNTKIVVESLISKAVKNDQEVIQKLIRNKEIPITIRLTVLSMAKKCGKLSSDGQEKGLWKGSIPIEELKDALVHFDDRVRVQGLKLISETHKITEPYEEIDLELLKFFFKYNANCQSPATRDQFMAFFKNCFLKIGALISGSKKKKDDQAVEFYKKFLYDLRAQSFLNLELNGNFSRRSMSLSFIDQISSTLEDFQEKIHSPEEIDILVKCLGDSYENNKILALSILKGFCSEDVVLKNHSDMQTIRPLITSINPVDSVTAAYNLQLIVSLARTHPEIYHRKLYVTFSCLIEIVIDGIRIARSSLARAARRNPIYGALLCIRYLLAELDVKQVRQDPMWQDFIDRLINICFASSMVVKSIVNNSSPEGHLPNDFGETKEFGDAEGETVTPQMVLLMGWRTIKEASLLLGDISVLPLKSSRSPNDGLVTVSAFFRIGDHFRELLAETKHRGAFEQAYVGFSKLCCRLWTAQEEELHSKPMEWLSELMDVVQGKVELNSKICATRRSAGVPFMVQALITSEIQVCSSKALRFCMNTLFELCESVDGPAEARTHALNILRALFRCTDLNEAVVEFVDRGIMAAISSSAAPTWPEKNSATLLFSALMIRVFGVQRTKDTEVLNVRNKMTGRIFFLRYPRLYDFFLRELDAAHEILEKNGRAVKLFPILLVLSRLYPSALEGTESSLSLQAFVEKIEKCNRCPEMKTRVLIAKSIASLLTCNLAWEYLNSVLESLKTAYDLNIKHSKLLTIQQVLSSSELTRENGSDEANLLAKDLLLQVPLKSTHWLLTKAFLEILIVLNMKFRCRLADSGNLLALLEEAMLSRHENNIGCGMGFDEVLRPFVVLQLLLCGESSDKFLKTVLRFLELDIFRETAIGVMLLAINDVVQELPEDLELTKWERCLVNNLSMDLRMNLKQQFESTGRIVEICHEVVGSEKSSYDLKNKSLALLAYFPNLKAAANEGGLEEERVLGELCDTRQSYQARAATYKWYMRNCDRLQHALPLVVIQRYSTVENTFDIRMSSAEILKRFPVTKEIVESDDDVLRYMSVVLLLLRDDDAEVRESVCGMIQKLVSGTTEAVKSSIELFSQEKFLVWMSSELQRIRGVEKAAEIFSSVISDIQKGQQEDVAIRAISCTDEETSNEDNRVFDRNEANQFAEIEVLIEGIQQEIVKMRKVC